MHLRCKHLIRLQLPDLSLLLLLCTGEQMPLHLVKPQEIILAGWNCVANDDDDVLIYYVTVVWSFCSTYCTILIHLKESSGHVRCMCLVITNALLPLLNVANKWMNCSRTCSQQFCTRLWISKPLNNICNIGMCCIYKCVNVLHQSPHILYNLGCTCFLSFTGQGTKNWSVGLFSGTYWYVYSKFSEGNRYVLLQPRCNFCRCITILCCLLDQFSQEFGFDRVRVTIHSKYFVVRAKLPLLHTGTILIVFDGKFVHHNSADQLSYD